MSLVLFLMPILLSGGVRNVVIFGPPGVGKGTQSKHIAERWGLCHVSTGDLLRAEVASGSRRSKRLAADMKNGVLVPDRVLLRLVRQALDGEQCQSKGWLLDGFPRTEAQALASGAGRRPLPFAEESARRARARPGDRSIRAHAEAPGGRWLRGLTLFDYVLKDGYAGVVAALEAAGRKEAAWARNASSMVASRLGRLANLARSPFDVTLFVDDDTCFSARNSTLRRGFNVLQHDSFRRRFLECGPAAPVSSKNERNRILQGPLLTG